MEHQVPLEGCHSCHSPMHVTQGYGPRFLNQAVSHPTRHALRNPGQPLERLQIDYHWSVTEAIHE
jgi:hypothetical protein